MTRLQIIKQATQRGASATFEGQPVRGSPEQKKYSQPPQKLQKLKSKIRISPPSKSKGQGQRLGEVDRRSNIKASPSSSKKEFLKLLVGWRPVDLQ